MKSFPSGAPLPQENLKTQHCTFNWASIGIAIVQEIAVELLIKLYAHSRLPVCTIHMHNFVLTAMTLLFTLAVRHDLDYK